jgi:hypothetical protein
MKAESFIDNVTWIGDHIMACKTAEQLLNMENFYRMIVSKDWCQDVSQDSIDKAVDHLNKLNDLQILKIQNRV